MKQRLGEFEQLLLFALLHLGDEAYGVAIRQAVEERTGRTVSAGAVYVAMERLSEQGLVTSRFGETTPQRGGRRKKYYRLEPAGAEALQRSYETLTRMAAGLGEKLSQHAAGRPAVEEI